MSLENIEMKMLSEILANRIQTYIKNVYHDHIEVRNRTGMEMISATFKYSLKLLIEVIKQAKVIKGI